MERGTHSRTSFLSKYCQKIKGKEKNIRTFGVTYTIEIMHRDTCLRKTIPNNSQNPLPMMLSGISGKKTTSGWCDVRVSDIGQDRRTGSIVGVFDYSCAELIG